MNLKKLKGIDFEVFSLSYQLSYSVVIVILWLLVPPIVAYLAPYGQYKKDGW
jgi:hypothetical protein